MDPDVHPPGRRPQWGHEHRNRHPPPDVGHPTTAHPVRAGRQRQDRRRLRGHRRPLPDRPDPRPRRLRRLRAHARRRPRGLPAGLGLHAPLRHVRLPLQAITRRAEQLSEPEAGQRTTGWVLLVFLILFLTSSVPGDGVILSSAFGSIILMLAAWWALDKRTPAPPAGLLATPPTATMTQPVDLSMFTPAEAHARTARTHHSPGLGPARRRPFRLGPARTGTGPAAEAQGPDLALDPRRHQRRPGDLRRHHRPLRRDGGQRPRHRATQAVRPGGRGGAAVQLRGRDR
ncbi:hypothetical protein QP028_04570 [Corynebacterium suedekumii]|nr:hypothetical protein QP028_04570 [Corynebacterium suedekumii]